MSNARLGRAAAASISAFALVGGLWGTSALAGPATSATTTTVPVPVTPTVPVPTTGTSTTTSTSTPTTPPPTPTTPTTSPGVLAQHLLVSSISSANSEPGVTWTTTEVAGQQTLLEVAHAGRKDGTETILAHLGSQTWEMDLVLIGNKVYILGNSTALVAIVGFKPATAKTHADKWFWVPSSTGLLFDNLTDGLTVTTASGDIDMVGVLSVLPQRTISGQKVVGIRQAVSAGIITLSETVYVSAGHEPLPVEAVTSVQGQTDIVRFGPWGQVPVVAAPAAAVAFNKTWLSKPLPSL